MNLPLIRLPFFNSKESARAAVANTPVATISPQICLAFITSLLLIRCAPLLAFGRLGGCQSAYFLRPGGKSFNSFCAPLLSLSWFFSGFLLGSIACWAPPIHTSLFAAGSYIPRTKVPMLMVEVVAENELSPPPQGPHPPQPPQPSAKPLICFC